MKKAELLIKMGIHTADIVLGFRKGLEEVETFITNFKSKNISDVRNVEEVSKYLFSAISSKQLGLEHILCKLVAEACIKVCPEEAHLFNVENVRVVKLQGSNLSLSEVVKGMILLRVPEGAVTSVENAKVAVFQCPFTAPDAEAKATVVMKDENDLLQFSKGEEKEMEDVVLKLKDKGINCIIVNGPISDLALHYLNNSEIMVIRQMSK